MISEALQTAVGEAAPQFTLPSVQGGTVDLATYRGRRNVVIWFSRGFTCPFCRSYMEGIIHGYESLRATETEVIQVAPNLLESARRFFGLAAPSGFFARALVARACGLADSTIGGDGGSTGTSKTLRSSGVSPETSNPSPRISA